MARRDQDESRMLGVIFPLAAMVMFVVFFVPGARLYLLLLGLLVAGVAIIGGLFRTGSTGHGLSKLGVSLPESSGFAVNPETFTRRASRPLAAELPANERGDLVEQLRAIDWFQFEKVVAATYRKRGYSVQRRGGANADGGIDLLIRKDGETRAVQCKQWKTWNVGVKPVREFLGALTDAKIEKGVFITLNGYTAEAKRLAEKHGIEIVNETGLSEMLEGTDVRSDSAMIALLHDARKFCPKCEREMVLRTARKGKDAGQQFWGCSAYPKCRFTMSAS